jgi:hypothetical protein
MDAATLARLARLTSAWANYRTYGYTRQPLEMLVWRGSVRDSLPPKWQGMLAHLSAGAELRGWKWNSIDSLRENNSAVVELGVLRYRRNYTQYSGLSLIATLSSGQSAGYGVLAHLARGLRGGVVLRKIDGKRARSVLVSTDLYGLLERSKKPIDKGIAIARGIALLPHRPSP